MFSAVSSLKLLKLLPVTAKNLFLFLGLSFGYFLLVLVSLLLISAPAKGERVGQLIAW